VVEADAIADPKDAGAPDRVAAVRLINLRKEFGSGSQRIVAVDGIDLDIADGEFITLLGPSGSGKTTVLRMIAGFERPTAGTVLLGGRDVTTRAPFERDVNTVFQDYAVFPHMNVAQNVEYGLRVKRVPKGERRARVKAALVSVQLDGFEGRRSTELSGGQRQRVALARALVNRPKVLLLDEPLGALDLKLREQMQLELKQIQREVGITFVFVTHDQDEALTMSDRIVVFSNGRIEQVGTPSDVYERPASPFVAGFVGTSNLLRGEVAASILGQPGIWSIRPEKIRLESAGMAGAGPEPGEIVADGVVAEAIYAGSASRLVVTLDAGGQLVVIRHNVADSTRDVGQMRGQRVRLLWRRDHVYRVADARADHL
jgi:putative spermidine/putrescine transport system ATP-binding protein